MNAKKVKQLKKMFPDKDMNKAAKKFYSNLSSRDKKKKFWDSLVKMSEATKQKDEKYEG